MVLRLAVAGLGVVARVVHLPLIARRPDLFAVHAVCDLSATTVEDVAAQYGVPAAGRYTDLASMLDGGGFDALVLLTSGSHGAAAKDALRRGYPVLCEKPLAYTRGEAAELAAAQSGSPRLMVGYMKQYDPAVIRAAALLDELGGPAAVRAIDVTVLHPISASQIAFAHLPAPPDDVPADVLAALSNAEEELLDSALGDAPPPVRILYDVMLGSISHDLSLLRMLAGSPATIDHVATWPDAAALPAGDPPSIELAGRLTRAGRYGIRWHYLPDYPAYRETLTVHHDRGSLELVFPAPYLLNAPTELTVVDTAGGAERRAAYRSVTEAFGEELAAFHAMVTVGTPPRTGIAGGAADIVTAQRAARRLAELTGHVIGGEAGAVRAPTEVDPQG